MFPVLFGKGRQADLSLNAFLVLPRSIDHADQLALCQVPRAGILRRLRPDSEGLAGFFPAVSLGLNLVSDHISRTDTRLDPAGPDRRGRDGRKTDNSLSWFLLKILPDQCPGGKRGIVKSAGAELRHGDRREMGGQVRFPLSRGV